MDGLKIIENLEQKLNDNPNQEEFFNDLDRKIICVLKQKVEKNMGFDDIIRVLEQVKSENSSQFDCTPLTLEAEIRRVKNFLNC